MPDENPDHLRLSEHEDMQAIIGKPPGWMLRWGTTALAAGVLLMLAISWFVRYPDVVEAQAVLTTQHPPIRVVAGQSARISQLLVQNGSLVNQGGLLAVFDNPAHLPDIQALSDFLKNLDSQPPSALTSVLLPEPLQLGSLQAGYARFSQKFKDLQFFLRQDVNFQKMSNLRSQIAATVSLNHSLSRQEALLDEEVALARENFRQDSLLFESGALNRLEKEQSQTAWLRLRRELQSLRTGAVQNELRIRQMEAQILDLRQLQSNGHNDRVLDLRSELQQLRGEIETWKNTWLLVAPIAGEVALTNAWSEQQFVEKGAEVLTIVPRQEAGPVIARALLPGAGAGKVSAGLPVNIRLEGYPYRESGVLTGKVSRIGPVPVGGGYEIEIALPGSLLTSYGQTIPFRQEMKGTARIVTKKRSLLERLFERVWGWGAG
ncbi:MAG: HlyD family efflux transporter periplasmic adaptor subunit [Saprospiraceae bacterium]|nr:MAG: HlyD family efflux transporter periplasmic adaptor subunit [Saprospiraceae bacterium]